MIKRSLLLILIIFISNSYGFREFEVNGKETILALEREDIKIKCQSDAPMSYCGFVHPTGKRYSFTGASLDAGQCQVRIKASQNDSGDWKCHIGLKDTIGLEETKIINLRVAQELAALENNVTAVHGKTVTIACATTNGMISLKYCRFEPPNGKPFSINSDVSSTSPILNRYYFPKNKSLDRGDCAVTIKKVKYEDVGTWTCGAGFDGKEHIDIITVEVEGLYTMSKASATGITFGAIGIVAFLGILAFIVWKKRNFLGSSGQQDVEMNDEHELGYIPAHHTPRASREGSPQRSLEASPLMKRIPLVPVQPHSKSSTSPVARQESPQPQRLREASPLTKQIPLVTIQSPSPSSTSPVARQESPQPQRSREASPLTKQISLVPVQSPSKFSTSPVARQESPEPQRSREASPLTKHIPLVPVQSPSKFSTSSVAKQESPQPQRSREASPVTKHIPLVPVQSPSKFSTSSVARQESPQPQRSREASPLTKNIPLVPVQSPCKSSTSSVARQESPQPQRSREASPLTKNIPLVPVQSPCKSSTSSVAKQESPQPQRSREASPMPNTSPKVAPEENL